MNCRNYATAHIKGGEDYPEICGVVMFYRKHDGVLVTAKICGLPDNVNKTKVYGFHIHEGSSCSGNANDEFADTFSHFNPTNTEHPMHAGDMPPLFSNNGKAYLSFVTNRFTVPEIIGKTVVIHLHPDDMMTQPSGNSGTKIACGVIL